MLQRFFISLGILGAILIAILGLIMLRQSPRAVVPPIQFVPNNSASRVVISGTTIPVEIAQTSAAREKGLSGRPSLDADKGLLFIFETAGIHRFWMPNMNFPIDIIWIEGGKVVDIDHEVTNVFNSQNPTYYSPSLPVRYVLEVNAGFAKENGISIGDPVDLIIP